MGVRAEFLSPTLSLPQKSDFAASSGVFRDKKKNLNGCVRELKSKIGRYFK